MHNLQNFIDNVGKLFRPSVHFSFFQKRRACHTIIQPKALLERSLRLNDQGHHQTRMNDRHVLAVEGNTVASAPRGK